MVGESEKHVSPHHTLLLIGAEAALRWAVVFHPQEMGSSLKVFFVAAGRFRVFIPSRWLLVSFSNEGLVTKNKNKRIWGSRFPGLNFFYIDWH